MYVGGGEGGGADLTEKKDMSLGTHVRYLFQSRMLRKVSKTFRMFSEDSGCEDLAAF